MEEGLKRRITAVAGRRYRWLAARLTRYRIVQRVTTRLKRGMPAPDVLDLFSVLGDAGIRAWVAGGWGVDALVGEQTRKHLDLDVVVDRAQSEDAQRALAALGFSVRYEQVVAGAGLPDSLTMGDASGRKVDLHPVDLAAEPFAGGGGVDASASVHSHAFTVGTIAGEPVPCLSAQVQLAFHRGYDAREADEHDVGLLADHINSSARAT